MGKFAAPTCFIRGLVLLTALCCVIGPADPVCMADEELSEAEIADIASDQTAMTIDETKLKYAVRLALLDHLEDRAMPIKVGVTGDEVILHGMVEQRSTQELAEEIVISVDGVDKVINRLKVGTPPKDAGEAVKTAVSETGNEVSDAALESMVKLRLINEIARFAFDVEVEATGGVVSIRGALPTKTHKRHAIETVEETKGVKEVIDLITIEE